MWVVKGHGGLTGQDIAHSSKEPVDPVEDRSIGTLRSTSTDGQESLKETNCRPLLQPSKEPTLSNNLLQEDAKSSNNEKT